MAMYSTTLRFHSNKPIPTPTAQRKNDALLRQVTNHLISGLAGGAGTTPGFEVLVNSSAGQKARSTLALSGGSGSVGATINGVTVTATWATSDTNSMSLIVAAINASTDPLVQYLVEASNTRGTIALASVVAGTKLFIGQYEFKAISGTPANYGEFDISGSNNADALSLTEAINRHPQVSRYYQAHNATAGSATVQLFRFATPPGGTTLAATATTMTLVQPVAAATGCVRAIERGLAGNCITFAASGTGVTAGDARLVVGAGSNVTQYAGLP